jgi:hypothetical protein
MTFLHWIFSVVNAITPREAKTLLASCDWDGRYFTKTKEGKYPSRGECDAAEKQGSLHGRKPTATKTGPSVQREANRTPEAMPFPEA